MQQAVPRQIPGRAQSLGPTREFWRAHWDDDERNEFGQRWIVVVLVGKDDPQVGAGVTATSTVVVDRDFEFASSVLVAKLRQAVRQPKVHERGVDRKCDAAGIAPSGRSERAYLVGRVMDRARR